MTRFVDQATIFVEAGHGGKGCRSFYRDLWTRHPVPDGGDGGRGGDVLLHANPHLTTLLDFQAKRHFRAASGGNASSKRKHGAQGTECVIGVPLGTVLWDAESRDLIQEILEPREEVVVAKGGAGGIGNASLSKNRFSREPGRREVDERSLEGAPGERRTIRLELKLIADVGIVGLPNAGKSTLLGRISKAKPKVAPFPFTTTSPILGVIELPAEGSRAVAVDVPGLMEGAHRGKGLGLAFLRHIERTKLLVHLIDLAAVDGRDPVADYQTLNAELKAYAPAVAAKPQIVVANKMDSPPAKTHLVRFKKKIKVQVVPISALTGKGVSQLLHAISKKLKET